MSSNAQGQHCTHRLRRSDERHTTATRRRSPSATRRRRCSSSGRRSTRHGLWRRLWLALAEARAGARRARSRTRRSRRCARTSTTSTSTRSRAYERRFRHDVMAHVHAFGDVAPAARGVHPPRRDERVRHRQRRPDPDARAASSCCARRSCARAATLCGVRARSGAPSRRSATRTSSRRSSRRSASARRSGCRTSCSTSPTSTIASRRCRCAA